MAFAKPKTRPYVHLIRQCTDCKYCILRDYGYSNYTVEGTSVHCALNAHPNGVFDRGYGITKELQHAETCPSFIKGEPFEVDVEREAERSATPSQQELLDIEKTIELISKG
jgi:hypothetical protein